MICHTHPPAAAGHPRHACDASRLSSRWGRVATVLAAPLLLAGACGGGGGISGNPLGVDLPDATGLKPADLAVLYAEGDADSEAMARAYQAARGIPEANLIKVAINTSSDSIGATEFAAVKTALDARLPASVQATLVTWTKPSRVAGSCTMGITSALAFGYDARWCGGCNVTATSPYFDTTTAKPFTELNMRPSMMLGTTTLADAQALIQRGVAADGSISRNGASGHAWLIRTNDANRNVRWPDFQALAARTIPGITMHYVDSSTNSSQNAIAGATDVMFYFTGLVTVPGLADNRYLPGAVGDSLTSTAGYLPDGGQTGVRDWLRAGLTGSFGNVEEPCNRTQKFPQASLMVRHYAAGDTLIEAYWRSVQTPGQGLFVGEPLARPWAR